MTHRHHYKTTLGMAALGFVLAVASLNAYADDSVLGYWAGESSIIHVQQQEGMLSATVVALKDPRYTEEEGTDKTGEIRLDDNNPDESLRHKPLLGINLLSQYTHTGKRWEGKIYDPESGNIYSSRMEVDRKGNLKMRGYIGTPLLGRTAIFEPLSNCTPAMQDMLTASEYRSADCES